MSDLLASPLLSRRQFSSLEKTGRLVGKIRLEVISRSTESNLMHNGSHTTARSELAFSSIPEPSGGVHPTREGVQYVVVVVF